MISKYGQAVRRAFDALYILQHPNNGKPRYRHDGSKKPQPLWRHCNGHRHDSADHIGKQSIEQTFNHKDQGNGGYDVV